MHMWHTDTLLVIRLSHLRHTHAAKRTRWHTDTLSVKHLSYLGCTSFKMMTHWHVPWLNDTLTHLGVYTSHLRGYSYVTKCLWWDTDVCGAIHRSYLVGPYTDHIWGTHMWPRVYNGVLTYLDYIPLIFGVHISDEVRAMICWHMWGHTPIMWGQHTWHNAHNDVLTMTCWHSWGRTHSITGVRPPHMSICHCVHFSDVCTPHDCCICGVHRCDKVYIIISYSKTQLE